MKSPIASLRRRALAHCGADAIPLLAGAAFPGQAEGARVGIISPQLPAHPRRTPSPCGQHAVPTGLLPDFSVRAPQGDRCGNDSGGEPAGAREGSDSISSKGTGQCPPRHSFSRRQPHSVSRPAGKPCRSRRSAGRPSVQVPQPSPAAASRRAQPLVLPATSPTARFTPADVTDRGRSDRRAALTAPTGHPPSTPLSPLLRGLSRNPAQPRLRRGFCVFKSS